MTTLERLSEWYKKYSVEDGEQEAGVTIETMDDRPGWSVRIDLESTPLVNRDFEELKIDFDSDSDWLRCWKEGTAFFASCAPKKLDDALTRFLDWAGV